MNNYAIVSWTDGTFLLREEHKTKESAFSSFHSLCATLYGDPSMKGKRGMVKVLDENLDCVENKMEFIDRSGENTEEPNVVEEQPAEE